MIMRIIKYLLLSILGLILITLIILFTPAVWRHWVTYPRLEKEVKAFQKLRKEPVILTTYKHLPGSSPCYTAICRTTAEEL